MTVVKSEGYALTKMGRCLTLQPLGKGGLLRS